MTVEPAVAVVGCGAWGQNLVRTFAGLGALRAIHDPDAGAAASVGRRHDVAALAWSAILDDDAVSAVVIAAPASLHAQLALAALEAGKDVFVEKPLALTVEDAEQVRRRAEANGRVLMVGHLLQYHPGFRALEHLVADGALGRLLYIYSNRLNFGRIRREENALWSFAPHDISMILRLAGGEPETVTAVGANFLHTGLADVTTTHLEFSSGIRAHVFVSWLHPYKDQRLVVVGERGMAVFDDGRDWVDKVVHYPHQVEWRDGMPTPSKAEGRAIAVEPEEPLLRECRHFLECCARRSTPRTDGAEAVRVLRVLARAQASMRNDDTDPSTACRPEFPEGVFVHETSYVDEPAAVGTGTRIWHFSHVLANSVIGRDCTLGQNVSIGPDVTIGDRCKLQNNVSVYKGVTLEDGVFCGPSAVFTNVLNPRAEIERKDEFAATVVGRGATIGANATIVCGHKIGANAMIAAGAVVTSDVPAYALMMGIPARRVGWVSAAGERLGEDLVCPRSGKRYRQVAADILEEISR